MKPTASSHTQVGQTLFLLNYKYYYKSNLNTVSIKGEEIRPKGPFKDIVTKGVQSHIRVFVVSDASVMLKIQSLELLRLVTRQVYK